MSDIRDVFPDIPPMSDEMRLGMHRKYAKPYIFYKKHKTYVDCYCTHCMKRYQFRLDTAPITPRDDMLIDTARSIKANELIACPECGIKAMAKPDGIGRRNLTEYRFICCFHVLENGRKIYAVCGELLSGYGDMPVAEMEKRYGGSRWYEYIAVEYTPGNSEMSKYSMYYGNDLEKHERMYEPYIMNGIYGRDRFTACNPEVLKESFLKYSLPAEYAGRGELKDKTVYDGYKPLLFMMYAARYPAVEMLLKNGFGDVVEDIIDKGRSCRSVIDLNGRTAAEVFKIDPNEAALIKQAAKDIFVNIDMLQAYRRLRSIAKKQRRKYKFIDAVNIVKFFQCYYNDVLSVISKTGLSPEQCINYMDKIRKISKKRVVYTSDYIDYITECEKLGYDIRDSQINRPKDFYAAHERTSKAWNTVQEERLAEELRKKSTEYQREIHPKNVDMYEYSDGKYCIIVPETALDIVNEGKMQRHCVAGYADRHIRGKLAILFMRDKNDPEKALYTIEMHGDRLIQIRGCENSDPTADAMKFVNKWLKWVSLPESKKHPKQKQKKSA